MTKEIKNAIINGPDEIKLIIEALIKLKKTQKKLHNLIKKK